MRTIIIKCCELSDGTPVVMISDKSTGVTTQGDDMHHAIDMLAEANALWGETTTTAIKTGPFDGFDRTTAHSEVIEGDGEWT